MSASTRRLFDTTRRFPSVEELESRSLPAGISWSHPLLSAAAPADSIRMDVPGWQVHLQRNADALLVPAGAKLRGTPGLPDGALRLHFLGASPNVRAVTRAQKEGREPERVVFRNLYKGIDVVYREKANQLQFVFLIHPGANPRKIRLAYEGAEKLQLDAAGHLHLTLPNGTLAQEAPFAYQVVAGQRQPVQIRPKLQANGRLRFQIGAYDPSRLLVIDPEINNPPTAIADSYLVVHDHMLEAGSVLDNDSDPEQNDLTAILVSGTSNGSLSFGLDGNFTYVPNDLFVGTDSFVYRTPPFSSSTPTAPSPTRPPRTGPARIRSRTRSPTRSPRARQPCSCGWATTFPRSACRSQSPAASVS
jgi:hypothetical protein